MQIAQCTPIGGRRLEESHEDPNPPSPLSHKEAKCDKELPPQKNYIDDDDQTNNMEQ